MKKTKLLASLVAASFLLAGAPAAITIPAGSDGAAVTITQTAEAAKGGARIKAPKPAASPAPKSNSASSKSDSGEHKSVSGGGKEYTPSKNAKDLEKNPSAAAGKNTTAASNPAQSSSRLGSIMRGVGMLAGGMFLGSMLASLFGMGGGLFADILGLIMNVVLLMAVIMAIRWAWNKFRGNKEENPYARGRYDARRSEPIDITPRETSSQTFQDIRPLSTGKGENGSDARSIANKYRNM